MPVISPNIPDTVHSFLAGIGKNKTSAAGYILEAMPELYRKTQFRIMKRFEISELKQIVNSFEGVTLSPVKAGLYLVPFCRGIDFKGLTIFEKACIELWAVAYWMEPGIKDEFSMVEYINGLT